MAGRSLKRWVWARSRGTWVVGSVGWGKGGLGSVARVMFVERMVEPTHFALDPVELPAAQRLVHVLAFSREDGGEPYDADDPAGLAVSTPRGTLKAVDCAAADDAAERVAEQDHGLALGDDELFELPPDRLEILAWILRNGRVAVGLLRGGQGDGVARIAALG